MRMSDWSSDVCSSDLCVTQFIDENLAGAIAIPRLSNVAGLSPSHFLRLFKVATGQTPHQFIVRRRVEKAQHLLRGTSQPIAQIAFACGFSHQQHFSNVFPKFNGMTPANFRRATERRSEEGRVGKECVSRLSDRCAPVNKKNKNRKR